MKYYEGLPPAANLEQSIIQAQPASTIRGDRTPPSRRCQPIPP
jgi:hypothetical protein